MAQNSPDQDLLNTSVSDLQADLRDGDISPHAYSGLVRRKSRLTNLEILQKEGFTGVFSTNLVEQLEEGVDKILSATPEASLNREDFVTLVDTKYPNNTPEQKTAIVNTLMNLPTTSDVVEMALGTIMVLFAPIEAAAKAVGANIQSLALEAGASERTAWWLGFLSEHGIAALWPTKIGAKAIEATAPLVLAAQNGLRQAVVNTGVTKALAFSKKRGTEITDAMVSQAHDLARRAIIDGTEDAERAFTRHMIHVFTGPNEMTKIKYEQKMVRLLTEWEKEEMSRGNIRGAMQNLADDILNLNAERLGVFATHLRPRLESGWLWTGTKDFYYNAILAYAPFRAFVGNTVNTGTEIAKRFAADGTEGFYFAKGFFLANRDALRSVAQTLKNDASRLDQYAAESIGDWQTVNKLIRLSHLDKLGDLPTSTGLLKKVDNLFDPRLGHASFYSDAIKEASQLGLKGVEHTTHVFERLAKPTQPMIDRAVDLTNEITFRSQLGPWASGMQKTLQWGPGYLWFPIMKSGTNAVKYTWAHTPGLQFLSHSLYADLSFGGTRGARARGRIIVTNMLAYDIWELAKEDMITGAGPIKKDQRDAWLATHDPYSVRLGPIGTADENKWVSYRDWDIGSVVSLITNFAYVAPEMDQMTFEKAGQAAWFAMYNSILSNSWWRGVDGLINVTERGAEGDLSGRDIDSLVRPLTSPATIPLGRIAQAMDPVVREAHEFLDSIKARIPSMSTDLPEHKDIYGDVATPAAPFGIPALGLFSPVLPPMRTITKDRVKNEGAMLEIETPRPFFRWTIGGSAARGGLYAGAPGTAAGVTLNPWQRDKVIDLYKSKLRDPNNGIEATLLDTEGYKNSTTPDKRRKFQEKLSLYKKLAEQTFIDSDEEIQIKMRENTERRLRELRGEVTPGIMDALQPASAEALPVGGSDLTQEQVRNLNRFGMEDDAPSMEGMPESLGGIPPGIDVTKPEPLQLIIAPARSPTRELPPPPSTKEPVEIKTTP